MPKEFDPSLTADLLNRLARACRTHLHDDPLADHLAALAEREEARVSERRTPGPEEAAALASALDKYLALADDPDATPQERDHLLPVRESARRLQVLLSAPLRAARARRVSGLYVILDPQLTAGRDVVNIAQAALRGGASAIQLRDKTHDKGDQLPVARKLQALCQSHDAAFIVNDHADLAVACGAHGLHLGQHDLPVAKARRILNPWQFLGTSSALLQEADQAAARAVDYIAVGAMYPTQSKNSTRPAGIQTLRRVRERIAAIPLVAIGGITLDNVDPVLQAGADGICVIGAVCQAQDPEKAARSLVERIAAAHTTRQP